MNRYKYPSTYHLPWSPGSQSDDNRLRDTAHFRGREVVVTEKMDGENATIYSDGTMHARSIDGRHHPSRDWVKAFAARVGHQLPEGWRLCGENLFAEHSLRYDELGSYFYLFSVWNSANVALSWDETVEWASMLDVHLVPELWRGVWDEKALRALSIDPDRQEGFVVRVVDDVPFDDFSRSFAKWVRAGHVQTDEHWMFQQVVPNGLADEN